MSEPRIVVACRLPGALRLGDRPQEALHRLDRLVERATVLGGSLVAASYDSVVFAWDDSSLQEAISLATGIAHTPARSTAGEEELWACGVACGEIHVGKAASSSGMRVHWGEPIAAASALARLAKPKEVLVDVSIPAVVSHELLTNRARVGQVGRKRVRGFRLDSRQAWRAMAAADVARMVDAPLVGRGEQLARLVAATNVIILRADSGFGGSRMLAEVAAKTRPSRSLTLTPFSVVQEPLGALRRAMAFVAATERITLPANLHPILDQLLGAQGIALDDAALLIAHQIQRRPGQPLPSLLLDDATDLDEPSVEACARAVELLGGGVRVVARIDSMSQLPRSLARFSDGEEVTLGRLDGDLAQALAGACTGDALEAGARVQWARRGGGTPLGVVEAVAAGIANGELLWSSDTLERLKRTDASDVARPVGYWIARRAEGLRESSRDVLVALAHLGGEATAGELVDVVSAVDPAIELQAEIVVLRRGRWIREARPGVFVLATRAQREAILEFSRNSKARDWRAAVAKALERAPGTLRRAEAAQHAARAGMGEWASRLAMAAARTASQSGLEEAASTLAAFAGAQNPGSADLDLGELPIDEDVTLVAGANALIIGEDGSVMPGPGAVPARVPPVAGPAARAPYVADNSGRGSGLIEIDLDEEEESDATLAFPGLLPPPAPVAPPPQVVVRPDLPPPGAPTRIMARAVPPALPTQAAPPIPAAPSPPVSYQPLLDAARDLRETPWAELARRSLVDGMAREVQRRGLLALARAYAHEGRSGEALILALDALARMKESGDRDGIRTCLLFLARLYEQTERLQEAATLKSAAQMAG